MGPRTGSLRANAAGIRPRCAWRGGKQTEPAAQASRDLAHGRACRSALSGRSPLAGGCALGALGVVAGPGGALGYAVGWGGYLKRGLQ